MQVVLKLNPVEHHCFLSLDTRWNITTLSHTANVDSAKCLFSSLLVVLHKTLNTRRSVGTSCLSFKSPMTVYVVLPVPSLSWTGLAPVNIVKQLNESHSCPCNGARTHHVYSTLNWFVFVWCGINRRRQLLSMKKIPAASNSTKTKLDVGRSLLRTWQVWRQIFLSGSGGDERGKRWVSVGETYINWTQTWLQMGFWVLNASSDDVCSSQRQCNK